MCAHPNRAKRNQGCGADGMGRDRAAGSHLASQQRRTGLRQREYCRLASGRGRPVRGRKGQSCAGRHSNTWRGRTGRAPLAMGPWALQRCHSQGSRSSNCTAGPVQVRTDMLARPATAPCNTTPPATPGRGCRSAPGVGWHGSPWTSMLSAGSNSRQSPVVQNAHGLIGLFRAEVFQVKGNEPGP